VLLKFVIAHVRPTTLPNICAEGTSQCGSGFGATVSGLARDDSGNGVGTGDFGRAPGCGFN
jgi:hypothetical protein